MTPLLSAALLLLTAIATPACSSDDDGVEPPGTIEPTMPGDVTDGPSDPGDVGSEPGDTSQVEFECILDVDCTGERQICVNAECVDGCREDEDCVDDNICTTNVCRNSRCEAITTDRLLPDETPGDCKRPACENGVLIEVASPADLPPRSDDTFCVEPRCQGTTPVQFPNNELCRSDDPLDADNLCVPGQGCVVPEDLPDWVCEPFDPGYLDQEVCGDGQDNNGDGRADGDCPCEFGTVQRCFIGPPNARGVGQCTDGIQQCVNRDNPTWGPCTGGILPSPEVCNGRDNSCNGCVDDLPDCTGVLQCPENQVTQPFREYVLDASAFVDATVESYEWVVIPPANSNAGVPNNPNSPVTSMFMDVSGDYLVSLTVTDDKQDTFGCSWIVSAQGSGLRGELVWDTFGSVDLDLHLALLGTSTRFCDNSSCYYANCRAGRGTGGVNWGYDPSPGEACGRGAGQTCPNPRLDIDNIRGQDPENINVDNPNNGDVFRFMIHKFSGAAPTRPVLSVYCGGGLAAVVGEAPDTVTLTQAGGGCGGQTWRVADVNMIVDPDTGATACTVDILTGSSGGFDVRTSSSEL